LKKILNRYFSKSGKKLFVADLIRFTRLGFFIKIKFFDNLYIRFYPSSVSSTLFYDKKFYEKDINLIKKYLKKGDIFIDVGSNIGILSIVASKLVGRTGKIYSYEPHPRIFKYLEGNIKLNNIKNIISRNIGIGSKSGNIYITNKIADDMNYLSKDSINGKKIKVKKLDDIIRDKNIKMLKIDTEGYELEVLKGSKELLKNTKYLMIEYETKILKDKSNKFIAEIEKTHKILNKDKINLNKYSGNIIAKLI